MTSGSAAPANAGWEDDTPNDEAEGSPGVEVNGFLAAVSTMLQETIVRFEHTAGRVSDMIATQPGSTNRDLMMTLQEFDRLQQEFTALSGVLARFSSSEASAEAAASGRIGTAISGIALSDIKERLAQHLVRKTTEDEPPEGSEEAVF